MNKNEILSSWKNQLHAIPFPDDESKQFYIDNVEVVLDNILLMLDVDQSSIPLDYYKLINLMLKEDLYESLANMWATTYNFRTEYTSIERADIFGNYLKLLQGVKEEIAEITASLSLNNLLIGNVIMSHRWKTNRGYEMSIGQEVGLKTGIITKNSIELFWERFDLSIGKFSSYVILYNTSPVYDSFEQNPYIVDSNLKKITITDINKTQIRLKDLLEGSTYYILLQINQISGARSLEQLEVVTSI